MIFTISAKKFTVKIFTKLMGRKIHFKLIVGPETAIIMGEILAV